MLEKVSLVRVFTATDTEIKKKKKILSSGFSPEFGLSGYNQVECLFLVSADERCQAQRKTLPISLSTLI